MSEFWIDTRTADLLVGAEAADMRREEGGQDVVELKQLLEAPVFPFQPGDFERPKTKWDRDSCMHIGQWTLNIIESTEESPKQLKAEYMRRLYVLGIGPEIKRISNQNGFRNFNDYKRQIGAPLIGVLGVYADWDEHDVLEYVDKKWGDRKITAADIVQSSRRGEGPGMHLIFNITGLRVESINNSRGFYSIHKWQDQDYADWGAKVIAANQGSPEMLNAALISVLSRKERGPSLRAIHNHFESRESFRNQATSQYNLLLRKEVFARHELLSYFLSKSDLADASGRHYLATEDAVSFLKKNRQDLSDADVELVADRLEIFDTLWPPDNFRKHLSVTSQQLRAARDRRRARDRLAYRRRRNRQISAQNEGTIPKTLAVL